MADRDDNFTNRLFCLHNTFRDTYSNLEILSDVTCFIQKENESFYETIKKDIKVTISVIYAYANEEFDTY